MRKWVAATVAGMAVLAFGAGSLIGVYSSTSADLPAVWIAFQLAPFALVALAAAVRAVDSVGVAATADLGED